MSTACRARSALLRGARASPLVLFAQPVVEPPLALKDCRRGLDTPALAQGTYIALSDLVVALPRDIVRRVAARSPVAGRQVRRDRGLRRGSKAVETFLGARVMAVPVYRCGRSSREEFGRDVAGPSGPSRWEPAHRGPFPTTPSVSWRRSSQAAARRDSAARHRARRRSGRSSCCALFAAWGGVRPYRLKPRIPFVSHLRRQRSRRTPIEMPLPTLRKPDLLLSHAVLGELLWGIEARVGALPVQSAGWPQRRASDPHPQPRSRRGCWLRGIPRSAGTPRALTSIARCRKPRSAISGTCGIWPTRSGGPLVLDFWQPNLTLQTFATRRPARDDVWQRDQPWCDSVLTVPRPVALCWRTLGRLASHRSSEPFAVSARRYRFPERRSRAGGGSSEASAR